MKLNIGDKVKKIATDKYGDSVPVGTLGTVEKYQYAQPGDGYYIRFDGGWGSWWYGPVGGIHWRLEFLEKVPSLQYKIVHASGTVVGIDAPHTLCTDEQTMKTTYSHYKYLFDTRQEAEAALLLRSRASGQSARMYSIVEVGGPTTTSVVVARSNTHCSSCREPFPYDPMPANRPDGLTDCYRCKTMKGVFLP